MFRIGKMNLCLQISNHKSCLLSSFLSKLPSVALSHNDRLKMWRRRRRREGKYIWAGAEMFRAERPFKGQAGEQMAEPLLPHI